MSRVLPTAEQVRKALNLSDVFAVTVTSSHVRIEAPRYSIGQPGKAGQPGALAPEQPLYKVVWEIELHAGSPEEAAEEALRIQRDRESIATVFTVTEPNGNKLTFDLRK